MLREKSSEFPGTSMAADNHVPLTDSKGRRLYCVIVRELRYNRKTRALQWYDDRVHTHADSESNARVTYLHSIDRRTVKRAVIIAAAPVVGVHCDENGENLIIR